jgi:hypothetical protein
MIPRETISVVAPAGGWLTSNKTMHAPWPPRESRRQDSWPEDAGVRAEGHGSGARDNESAITANKPDRVTKDRIARTGGFGKRGKEQ